MPTKYCTHACTHMHPLTHACTRAHTHRKRLWTTILRLMTILLIPYPPFLLITIYALSNAMCKGILNDNEHDFGPLSLFISQVRESCRLLPLASLLFSIEKYENERYCKIINERVDWHAMLLTVEV